MKRNDRAMKLGSLFKRNQPQLRKPVRPRPAEWDRTIWQAPYTGGGKGRLPKGTRVKVSVSQRDPEPIRVYAQPIEYLRFEKELVPAAERSAAKYGGFSLSIPVAQLNTDFHLAAA